MYGIQATGSFSTDSILTIFNGTVKKAAYSSLSSAAWSLTGNTGLNALSNFIGTTDGVDLVVKTNNLERMRILGADAGSSKEGWVGLGTTTPRSPMDIAPGVAKRSVITIQNKNDTGYSSVDMYDASGVNLVNSFGYANLKAPSFIAGKDYFYFYNNDFLVTDGAGKNNYNLYLQANTGYIGINTNNPQQRFRIMGKFYLDSAFMPGGLAGTAGQLLTSAGPNLSPTWQNMSSLAWSLTGNGGTSSVTNFIGTTDSVDFIAKTNGTERMRILAGGGMTNTGSFTTASGVVNINRNSPNNTNINSGTSAGTVTIGNSGNNVLLLGNNVGVGTATPAFKLQVVSTADPLNLSGVQQGNVATDSVLVITSGGIVRKVKTLDLVVVSKNVYTATLPPLGNNGGDSIFVPIPNTPWVSGGPNPTVTVNPESDLPDGVVIAWCRVSAVNTVKIVFRNVKNQPIISQQIKFDIDIVQ
jgi:hypothetical protein